MVNIDELDLDSLFKKAIEGVHLIHENNEELFIDFKKNNVSIYRDKLTINVLEEGHSLEWSFISTPNICIKVVFKNENFVYGYYTLYLDMEFRFLEEFYKVYSDEERSVDVFE